MHKIYEEQAWNNYAMPFLAVMTSHMLEMNKAVAELGYGHVCDFGCGVAKVAPFLLKKDNVYSYTGIDASDEMIRLAHWHLDNFPEKPSTIIQEDLQKLMQNAMINTQKFDFGISINSYYTWENPHDILKNISMVLKPGAPFILITPNKNINMELIIDDAKRELVANPYFEDFKKINFSLSSQKNTTMVEMDDLIGEVRDVGFKVITANQDHYHQGLNFLSLTAPK